MPDQLYKPDQLRVRIHTDGACSGNPGPGGWAAIMQWKDKTREISGGAAMTTNNRMELQAVIEALKSLKRNCPIDLYTDSQYVRTGITEWIEKWKKNNWRNAEKKPVKNTDLWQELMMLTEQFDITWHWVRGHAGDEMNERVDALARAALLPFKHSA
jgi:ribonuclease HI